MTAGSHEHLHPFVAVMTTRRAEKRNQLKSKLVNNCVLANSYLLSRGEIRLKITLEKVTTATLR